MTISLEHMSYLLPTLLVCMTAHPKFLEYTTLKKIISIIFFLFSFFEPHESHFFSFPFVFFLIFYLASLAFPSATTHYSTVGGLYYHFVYRFKMFHAKIMLNGGRIDKQSSPQPVSMWF